MDFTEVYQEIRKAEAIAIAAQELMLGDETFRLLFDSQQDVLRRLTEKLKALEKEPAPAEDPCSTPGQDPEQLGSSRAAQAERGRTE